MNFADETLNRLDEKITQTQILVERAVESLNDANIKAAINSSFNDLKDALNEKIDLYLESAFANQELKNTNTIQRQLNNYMGANFDAIVAAVTPQIAQELNLAEISSGVAARFSEQNKANLQRSVELAVRSIDITPAIENFKSDFNAKLARLDSEINAVNISQAVSAYLESLKGEILALFSPAAIDLDASVEFKKAVKSAASTEAKKYFARDKFTTELLENKDLREVIYREVKKINSSDEFVIARFRSALNLQMSGLNNELSAILNARRLLNDLEAQELRAQALANGQARAYTYALN